jgi:hypothetical protein
LNVRVFLRQLASPTSPWSTAGLTTSTLVVDYMTDWIAEKLGGNTAGV